MKRLIAAGILMAAVITAYVSSLMYITKTCDETKKLILRCEEAYNDGDAYKYADELSSLWDEKEKALSNLSGLIFYNKNPNTTKKQ